MKKSWVAIAMAVVFGVAASGTFAADGPVSTANGGAGGTGGAAAGGTATGGMASNTNNTSGVASSTGGAGGTAQGGSGGMAQGGSGGAAQGGASTAAAQGGNVGTVSTGGSAASLGDVTFNLNQGSTPGGKDGLGVGVDPVTGHVMTDNKVSYSGSYKVKNTPDVGIGGPASGPCNGFSAGIGVSVAGFGIGANASSVDEGCTARETARVAAMLGRMDIANAVLENLPAVQAALRAKAEREAALRPRTEAPAPTPAVTAPLREDAKVQALREAAAKAARDLEQATREAALKDQQNLAQEALTRQATMAKANDTLRFTDATTQMSEKTPQEIMAEEATKKSSGADLQRVSDRKQEAPLQQVATTAPLPPQQTIPAQQTMPPQALASVRPDTPKAQAQSEGKATEKAAPQSSVEKLQSVKAAMSF